MAEYLINRGPRFGQTINLPQSQEVGLAMALGDITPVPVQQHAADPQEPRWGIGTDLAEAKYIEYRVGNSVQRYNGPVKGAAQGFKVRAWDGEKQDYALKGPDVPKHVIEEYALVKGK